MPKNVPDVDRTVRRPCGASGASSRAFVPGGWRSGARPVGGGGRAAGAVFLDRQASTIRPICARSLAAGAPGAQGLHRILDRLRSCGVAVGVATHNRAESWEAFDVAEIGAMNERIEVALGPIDVWCVCLVDTGGACSCEHGPDGVLGTGAEAIGVDVRDCAVVSDDARMMAAAERHGAVKLLADGPPAARAATGTLARVADTLATERAHDPRVTLAAALG